MKIMIIDDEYNICMSLKDILEDEGYQVETCMESKRALAEVKTFRPALILLDVRLDYYNGLDLLKEFKEALPNIQVIMISGHSGIQEAVTAIQSGALDFLEKPLSLHKVRIAVQNAIKLLTVNQSYNRLKEEVDKKYEIIGNSVIINQVRKLISRVAPTEAKVLIRGESGTGKELIAYGIHNQSNRKLGPFIKFNSAAIPNELIESELFGYEKGAFTGANKSKPGKVEEADGGTLFFDEIGDMNLKAQAKILRLIQEGEFERLGDNKVRKIDIRILAATHRNLEEMVQTGEFREDLYYRLNVLPIESPSLRERPEDIPVLLNHFSVQIAQEQGVNTKSFSTDAEISIAGKTFPGNVRQLRNLVERLYVMVDTLEITSSDLEMIFNKKEETDFWNETIDFKEKKRQFEIKYLTNQIRLHNNNLSQSARALGLQVSNLSRKIKELNLEIN
ncbi:MAG: sigma-54 dependent transcriptional regulator [Candidatus Cloacimonetes bacterium]|nr:sigma-54 dependent transcriptional regulator [Candidatus Cloacimonadota bacterium]